ncbi:MAG: hypothetical protein AAFU67_13190 [Bacteroidota bacterium]
MPNSVDNSELIALRNYVEKQREDVMDLTLRGFPSLKYFTTFTGVTGELLLEWRDIQKVIRPWANAFEAAADQISRHPVRIKNYFQKAELTISPKEDFSHYKGYLARTKMKASEYPFAQYAMMKAAEKVRTQMEFDQAFTGAQVDPATNATEIMDGLVTIIANDQAAGTPILTPVTTGAPTPANIIDIVELMDDSIDEEYRTNDMLLRCSPTNFRLYRRAYRAASGFHPGNPDTDAQGEITLDGSGTKLVSCPGMRGSNRFILTPLSNTYAAFDLESDSEVWEFEDDHRNIDAWLDHWFGVGFLIFDPRILYINDQA